MIDNNRVDDTVLNNNAPDYNVDRDGDLRDDVDTVRPTSGTEPATAHDVGIGGGIGAVGGAVVGALAGGPVGAVIGAIAGGAASAGAVDVVDKHDHDYARTVDANAADATGYTAMPGVASTTGAYTDPTFGTDPLDEDELDRDVSLDPPNRLTR